MDTSTKPVPEPAKPNIEPEAPLTDKTANDLLSKVSDMLQPTRQYYNPTTGDDSINQFQFTKEQQNQLDMMYQSSFQVGKEQVNQKLATETGSNVLDSDNAVLTQQPGSTTTAIDKAKEFVPRRVNAQPTTGPFPFPPGMAAQSNVSLQATHGLLAVVPPPMSTMLDPTVVAAFEAQNGGPQKVVYNDYSEVPDSAVVRKKTGGGVVKPFPEKLMQILDNEDSSIVTWLSHGRAFIVRSPKRFASEIMSKYFRQTKITSFQRQLNLYGFRRITQGPDLGAYYHELFLRGRPQLCKKMTRQKIKGTGHKQPTDAKSEPNFYTMKAQPGSENPAGAGENEVPFSPHLTGAASLLTGIAQGANLRSDVPLLNLSGDTSNKNATQVSTTGIKETEQGKADPLESKYGRRRAGTVEALDAMSFLANGRGLSAQKAAHAAQKAAEIATDNEKESTEVPTQNAGEAKDDKISFIKV